MNRRQRKKRVKGLINMYRLQLGLPPIKRRDRIELSSIEWMPCAPLKPLPMYPIIYSLIVPQIRVDNSRHLQGMTV